MMAGSPRFQNLVRGLGLAAARQTWEEKEQGMLSRLDEKARQRYARLVQQCRQVVQTEPGFEEAPGLSSLKSEGLNQLLAIYLRLLSLQGRIVSTLSQTRRAEVEADIKDLTAQIAQEPEESPVRRALQGTLEIQQARLGNLNKSQDNLKFTQTELGRIEKQVSLIAEEVATSKDPEQLSLTLDGAVKSIQGANKWMADHTELFESIDVPSSPVDIIGGSRQGQAQKQ
ncbi:MAG: hypothetical protein NTW86_14040 [Candidatus Sumerlaeota bacterium]|nr:hypothetical protein [Candidatus Sumerlaeota bacterium]